MTDKTLNDLAEIEHVHFKHFFLEQHRHTSTQTPPCDTACFAMLSEYHQNGLRGIETTSRSIQAVRPHTMAFKDG